MTMTIVAPEIPDREGNFKNNIMEVAMDTTRYKTGDRVKNEYGLELQVTDIDNNEISQPGHRHGQASPVLTANLPRKKSSGKINLFRGHLQLLILTTEITPNSDGPKLKVSATRSLLSLEGLLLLEVM